MGGRMGELREEWSSTIATRRTPAVT
jgi:hypothetical protein